MSILQQEISEAIQRIQSADAPMIVGLDGLDMDSQFAAWRLADRIGATIDRSLDTRGRGKNFALQSWGKVTATFGEIGARCDLLICWFCDPVRDAPEEFNLMKRQGTGQRIVVVDQSSTETSEAADEFLLCPSDQADTMLAILHRMLTAEDAQKSPAPDSDGAYQLAQQLLQRVEDATHVAQLLPTAYDTVCQESEWDLTTEMLFQITRQLNLKKPTFLTSTTSFNRAGAEYSLASATGFPCAVDLSQGHPRFFQTSIQRVDNLATGIRISCCCLLSKGAN